MFKSGYYEPGYNYKYFVPTLINDDWRWNDVALNNLLEKSRLR